MVCPVRPCLTALYRALCLPASVTGPLDFCALARFAANCLADAIERFLRPFVAARARKYRGAEGRGAGKRRQVRQIRAREISLSGVISRAGRGERGRGAPSSERRRGGGRRGLLCGLRAPRLWG